MLLERVDAELIDVALNAYVTKLNGNKNDLTITVTETYEYDNAIAITKTFSIRNNAEGVYNVGGYDIFADTKGNDQIRALYIVKSKAPVIEDEE